MTTYFQLRTRYRLIYVLFALISVVVFVFWVIELRESLASLESRQEELIQRHQGLLLERKAKEVEGHFQEIFQSTRTISLLPMVRGVSGGNRLNEHEDVVVQGRFSLDAHRTLQQVYASLHNNVQISEIYLVLDGFDPTRNVPFFMYDDIIAGEGRRGSRLKGSAPVVPNDQPPEVEDEEYRHFPSMLDWFRQHAPRFAWENDLDKVPVRLSPVLRTCDNSQYPSISQGNVADTHGFIIAIPVYALDSDQFKGMITTVIRLNVLEAMLVGVPFLPVTPEDEQKRIAENWSMPEPSFFELREKTHGIVVRDRRNTHLSGNRETLAGRWKSRGVDLKSGEQWELDHFIPAAEIDRLTAGITGERNRIIIGRLVLLLVLISAGLWNFVMLNRSRRELMAMAHFDPLTDLPNRRLFLDQLHQGLARAHRHQSKVALLLLDIRNFGAINDAYGNSGGDQLLMALGARLQQTMRGSDTVQRIGHDLNDGQHVVARLGGDEFTIICEDIQHPDDIISLVNRLREILHVPFEIGGAKLDVGVSIGVAVFPDDATEGGKLLTCADNAMHECRAEALPYFLFNEKLRERSDRLNKLSVELGRALELGQYEVFYQPKTRLSDGHIVSLEALLRWRHPQHGLVSPAEFIPILERSGQIVEVGQWVLEQSCRDLARLDAEGFNEVLVSVNVSVKQLRRGNLHETVADVLKRIGTDPRRIVLEVTESMMMENLEEGQQALARLDQLGTRLAIDDFGTGYSSLTYLQHLPLTYLKLDKAFIDGIGSPKARHIVQTVVHLARGLSLKTIAEGIETVEQREMLAAMGCDMIQGYLLSKPKPLSEIIDWMRAYTPTAE